ncbi:MAG TPA: hypothetical protein VHQ47_16825 [Phycisphaerae bacterium]|jgi:hypothetical protein|nr:hypothetical protein [Phycisphaerae bacterium]
MAFTELTSEFVAMLARMIKQEEQGYEKLAAEVKGMGTSDLIESRAGHSAKRAMAQKFAEECHASVEMLHGFTIETIEVMHRLRQFRLELDLAADSMAQGAGSAAAARMMLLARLHDAQSHLLLSVIRDEGRRQGEEVIKALVSSGHPRTEALRGEAIEAVETVKGAFDRLSKVEQLVTKLLENMTRT